MKDEDEKIILRLIIIGAIIAMIFIELILNNCDRSQNPEPTATQEEQIDQHYINRPSKPPKFYTDSHYKKTEPNPSNYNRAENGDLYNFDNDHDGRLEPVYVNGYFKKDGTYVRSHYRAQPGR